VTRLRHLRAVEALEAEATAVVLGALGSVLGEIATTFGAIVAAAGEEGTPALPAGGAAGGSAVGPGEAAASLDDLTRIQPEWVVKVDGQILPYYERVFEAGTDGAVEQIAGMRDVAVEVITEADPYVLDQRKTQHLASARDRFYRLGDETWEAARSELLEGFSAGEGIDPLRRRIEDVTELTKARAEALARTEVISASNAGATAQVEAMGDAAPPFRQWMATNDTRTRPTHRAADGQVVPRETPFSVGASSLEFPGDPSGPAGEVINCRCTILFLDSEQPEELPADLLAEIEAEMAGGDASSARQALADLRIGRYSRRASDRPAAVARLAEFARAHRSGVLSYCQVVIGPEQVDTNTGEIHTGSMIALLPSAEDAARLEIPGGEPVDQLHLTLAFLGEASVIPLDVQGRIIKDVEATAPGVAPLVLDPGAFGAAAWNPDSDTPSVVYSVGGDGLTEAREALAGPALAGDGFPLPEQHEPWVAHVCAAYGGDPAELIAQMEERLGPITFDRVRVSFGGVNVNDIPLGEPITAAATPEVDMPYTVRPGGDECPFEVVKSDSGERMGCHATQAEADEQVAALYAAEGEEPPAEAGTVAPELAPLPGEHWHAVMHTQGVSTGLRTFLNLSWRATPFAFHWQYGSAAHGGMPQTVQVGLTTRVVADPGDPNILHGFGSLDLGAPAAREYGRQLVGGFARSVSIGLDETPVQRTVVWPEGIDPSDPVAMMEATPEQVIIDGGRIGELSGVSVPAQDDATIEATPELAALYAPDEAGPMESLFEDVPVLSVRTELNPNSRRPLARNAAPPTSAELRPAIAALAASSFRIEVAEAPPAAWYQEPVDVDLGSALMVTDQGRIFGVLAPLGVNHRAFAGTGQRREVPFGNVDYSKFMGAWGITAAGLVPAGPLTMDTGHAPLQRTSQGQAVAHYDNSASVVASVAVGENRERRVVWVAGSLLPGVSVEQVGRMLACRCSGDWQRHADRAGWMELVACLLVPSPGYATGHQLQTSYDDRGALVASSVPVQRVGPEGPPNLAGVADLIASSIGVGRRDRLAEAVEIVGGEG
jgi:hypothetical protein